MEDLLAAEAPQDPGWLIGSISALPAFFWLQLGRFELPLGLLLAGWLAARRGPSRLSQLLPVCLAGFLTICGMRLHLGVADKGHGSGFDAGIESVPWDVAFKPSLWVKSTVWLPVYPPPSATGANADRDWAQFQRQIYPDFAALKPAFLVASEDQAQSPLSVVVGPTLKLGAIHFEAPAGFNFLFLKFPHDQIRKWDGATIIVNFAGKTTTGLPFEAVPSYMFFYSQSDPSAMYLLVEFFSQSELRAIRGDSVAQPVAIGPWKGVRFYGPSFKADMNGAPGVVQCALYDLQIGNTALGAALYYPKNLESEALTLYERFAASVSNR